MASISTVDPLSAMEESPNWLEMPHELMANILRRLGDVEILNSAVKVCTTWRRMCTNPSMWKAINILKLTNYWAFAYNRKAMTKQDVDYDHEALTKQAVHLSCGELIDISIEGFGNDDLLDYIVKRSSKLKSLCLTDCCNITSSGLKCALKMVPQLEKLHISYGTSIEKYTEVMVPNCPLLKSFKLEKRCINLRYSHNDDALAIAKGLPELRHLQLFGNSMTNTGLKAILDGCPHLESLDICMCNNINKSGKEVKLCMERIKNFKADNYNDGLEGGRIRQSFRVCI